MRHFNLDRHGVEKTTTNYTVYPSLYLHIKKDYFPFTVALLHTFVSHFFSASSPFCFLSPLYALHAKFIDSIKYFFDNNTSIVFVQDNFHNSNFFRLCNTSNNSDKHKYNILVFVQLFDSNYAYYCFLVWIKIPAASKTPFFSSYRILYLRHSEL